MRQSGLPEPLATVVVARVVARGEGATVATGLLLAGRVTGVLTGRSALAATVLLAATVVLVATVLVVVVGRGLKRRLIGFWLVLLAAAIVVVGLEASTLADVVLVAAALVVSREVVLLGLRLVRLAVATVLAVRLLGLAVLIAVLGLMAASTLAAVVGLTVVGVTAVLVTAALGRLMITAG